MRVASTDISWRTFVLTTGGLLALVVLALAGLVIKGYLPAARVEIAMAIVSDVGSIVFGLLAAALLFFAASHYDRGNPLHQIWLLLGAGIGVYAVGDIIWTVLEFGSGFKEVPYPSLADVAYVAMYFFVGAGLFRAAKSFRRVAKVDIAVMADIVAMFLGAVLVYVFVAAPVIVDSGSSLFQKVLGVAYPIGDIAVFLGPAIFIAFVASILGRSQPVAHWWTLAAGLAVMSLADIAFTWLDWTGNYFSGHPVDFAWMLSLLMIAIAGSMAADICIGHEVHPAPATAGTH
jgi:diguanylate cyclase